MSLDVDVWIEILNNAEWSRLGDFLDPEVIYTDPFSPTSVKGIDAVAKVFGVQHSIFRNCKYEVINTIMGENIGTLELKRTGNMIVWEKEPYAMDYELFEAVIFKEKNGKIVSYRRYFDLGGVFRLLESGMNKKENSDSDNNDPQ